MIKTKIESRVCIDCDQSKPIEDFFLQSKRVRKNKLGFEIRRTDCKTCHSKKSNKYFSRSKRKRYNSIYYNNLKKIPHLYYFYEQLKKLSK